MGFLCTHEGLMKEIRATAWQHFEGDLATVTGGGLSSRWTLDLSRWLSAWPGESTARDKAWEQRATEGTAVGLRMSPGYTGLKSAPLTTDRLPCQNVLLARERTSAVRAAPLAPCAARTADAHAVPVWSGVLTSFTPTVKQKSDNSLI